MVSRSQHTINMAAVSDAASAVPYVIAHTSAAQPAASFKRHLLRLKLLFGTSAYIEIPSMSVIAEKLQDNDMPWLDWRLSAPHGTGMMGWG